MIVVMIIVTIMVRNKVCELEGGMWLLYVTKNDPRLQELLTNQDL